MLKSMLALMAAGILGTGVPLAQQAATRTVAIDDLTLVGESGSVVPGAEQEQYHYHHGGYHHGGYHHHHGGYHYH